MDLRELANRLLSWSNLGWLLTIISTWFALRNDRRAKRQHELAEASDQRARRQQELAEENLALALRNEERAKKAEAELAVQDVRIEVLKLQGKHHRRSVSQPNDYGNMVESVVSESFPVWLPVRLTNMGAKTVVIDSLEVREACGKVIARKTPGEELQGLKLDPDSEASIEKVYLWDHLRNPYQPAKGVRFVMEAVTTRGVKFQSEFCFGDLL